MSPEIWYRCFNHSFNFLEYSWEDWISKTCMSERICTPHNRIRFGFYSIFHSFIQTCHKLWHLPWPNCSSRSGCANNRIALTLNVKIQLPVFKLNSNNADETANQRNICTASEGSKTKANPKGSVTWNKERCATQSWRRFGPENGKA